MDDKLNISRSDLSRIMSDARTRRRKTIYLPKSIYSEECLQNVRKLYENVYTMSEVEGTMNGLMIVVGN